MRHSRATLERLLEEALTSPGCPCPSCRRRRGEIAEPKVIPGLADLNTAEGAKYLRIEARVFDAISRSCMRHGTELEIGQGCPRCDYVAQRWSAEDFVEYLEPMLRRSA